MVFPSGPGCRCHIFHGVGAAQIRPSNHHYRHRQQTPSSSTAASVAAEINLNTHTWSHGRAKNDYPFPAKCVAIFKVSLHSMTFQTPHNISYSFEIYQKQFRNLSWILGEVEYGFCKSIRLCVCNFAMITTAPPIQSEWPTNAKLSRESMWNVFPWQVWLVIQNFDRSSQHPFFGGKWNPHPVSMAIDKTNNRLF